MLADSRACLLAYLFANLFASLPQTSGRWRGCRKWLTRLGMRGTGALRLNCDRDGSVLARTIGGAENGLGFPDVEVGADDDGTERGELGAGAVNAGAPGGVNGRVQGSGFRVQGNGMTDLIRRLRRFRRFWGGGAAWNGRVQGSGLRRAQSSRFRAQGNGGAGWLHRWRRGRRLGGRSG